MSVAIAIALAGVAGIGVLRGAPNGIGQFVPPGSAPVEKPPVGRVPKKPSAPKYAPDVVLVTYGGAEPSPVPTFRNGEVRDLNAFGNGAQRRVEALGLIPEYKRYRRYYSRYHLSAAAKERGETVESIIAKVRVIPGVRSVEPDWAITKDQALPDDPDFGQLWGLHNTGQDGGVNDADIDAPEGWEMVPDGPDTVVAVLDDGVDYTHPDLADNIYRDFLGNVIGYDTALDDPDPMPDSVFDSHGTHVAGTVAAVRNNGVGIAGVGVRVKVMPIRIYAGQAGWLSDLADGLEFARLNGARVCSVSYSISPAQVLIDAVQRLDATDVVYVNSAGNSGVNIDNARGLLKSYANNVMFVAATDRRDGLAEFSNFGATTDIAAPGVGILSTYPANDYASISGTSMSTPHVAAVVGIMRSVYPTWSAKHIIRKIRDGAQPLRSLDGRISGGRLNLKNALEYDTVPPAVPTNLQIVSRTTNSLEFRFNGTGDDGMNGSEVTYEAWASPNPITINNVTAAPFHTFEVRGDAQNVQRCTISGLDPNRNYYIAVRARDNVGTFSGVRVIGPVTTAAAVWHDTMETEDNWVPAKGSTWRLTEKAGFDRSRAWTDSHFGQYADNTDATLEMKKPYASTAPLFFRFRAKLDVEFGYDYVYLETSMDGAPWQTRLTLTGTEPWKQYSVPIPEAAGRSVRVRFRLSSDFSVTGDGVAIDDAFFVKATRLFVDPLNSLSRWNVDLPFQLSTESFLSPPTALNDSPGGQYSDFTDISATLKTPYNLGTFANPVLAFNLKRSLETGYDYLYVEAADSSGVFQTYGAFTGQADWEQVSVPLGNPSGSVTPRLRMVSDFLFTDDGVVIDDVAMFGEASFKVAYIEGLLDLDGYVGSLANRRITFQLRDPVTGALKFNYYNWPLYPAGPGKAYVRITTGVTGNYQAVVGQSPWIRTSAGNVSIQNGNVSFTATLVNGDVDRNNKVDASDLSKVRSALGTIAGGPGFVEAYDVNGDGRVNAGDEAIVLRNQGKVGL
jgi:subtilisin family serine protease